MSQEDAIDLTLVISDSEDDDVPICLSSRDSTPRPASSPEPEFQVIESPVGSAGVRGGLEEGRTRRRAERLDEPDATAILLKVLDDAFGPNGEAAEGSRTVDSPACSPVKSKRPKARRRVRPSTPDQAESTSATSQPTLSSPRVPAVPAFQPSRTSPPLAEPTSTIDDAQSGPGERVWKKKVRALNFSSTEELLYSVASTSTLSRTAPADRPVFLYETSASEREPEPSEDSGSVAAKTQETQPTKNPAAPVPTQATVRQSHKKKDRAGLESQGTSDPVKATNSGGLGLSQQPNDDTDASVAPIRESETPFAPPRPLITPSASKRTSSKAYCSLMDRFRGVAAGGGSRSRVGDSTKRSKETSTSDNAEPTDKAASPDSANVDATLFSLEMMDVDYDAIEKNATPGPSRIPVRAKQNHRRTAEPVSAPQAFEMDIDSSPWVKKASTPLPRALSILSVSSQSSALAEVTIKTKGSQGIIDAGELAGEEQDVISDGLHENADQNPEPTTASSDEFMILPASAAPRPAGRNRQRSSSPADDTATTEFIPKKGAVVDCSAKTDETISPVRRSARERKASEAMKTYVEQSGGPRFSKRLSQKTLPAVPAGRLPTPPPPASSRDVTPAVQDSPRFSKRLSQKAIQSSALLRLPTPPQLELSENLSPSATPAEPETPNSNARTGFSLPTVPWHPPKPASPTSSNDTARKLRKRMAGETNSIATKAPSAAALSSLPAPRVIGPAADEELPESLVEEIPFPPCDEGENEFLRASDFADTRLMAVFAALDTSGNKAMNTDEIAAVCIERGWLSKR